MKISSPLLRTTIIALILASLAYSFTGNSIALAANDKPSRPLLILYAFSDEGELLSQKMTTDSTAKILGRTVRMGVLEGKKIVLAESGVGMTNAAMTTQEMVVRFNPEGVIFSGIAGAIDPSVHIGDLCVCRGWATHDFVYYGPNGMQPRPIASYAASADSIAAFRFYFADSAYLSIAMGIKPASLGMKQIGTREPMILIGGNGVSGNAFVDNAEKRAWLQKQYQAQVTDMESAAVAQVCTANGRPFIIIRSASDLAGGSTDQTARQQLDQFFKVAATNSASLVMQLIKNLPQ